MAHGNASLLDETVAATGVGAHGHRPIGRVAAMLGTTVDGDK
jgi:hypothetical protein